MIVLSSSIQQTHSHFSFFIFRIILLLHFLTNYEVYKRETLIRQYSQIRVRTLKKVGFSDITKFIFSFFMFLYLLLYLIFLLIVMIIILFLLLFLPSFLILLFLLFLLVFFLSIRSSPTLGLLAWFFRGSSDLTFQQHQPTPFLPCLFQLQLVESLVERAFFREIDEKWGMQRIVFLKEKQYDFIRVNEHWPTGMVGSACHQKEAHLH